MPKEKEERVVRDSWGRREGGQGGFLDKSEEKPVSAAVASFTEVSPPCSPPGSTLSWT